MKEHGPRFEPIPDELVRQAASVDIVAYLTQRGEQLIPSGTQGSYRLPGHGGLIITGSMFNWIGKGEGGNAIKFLRSYYGMGFREAVEELLGSGAGECKAAPARPERPFTFEDIDLAPSLDRAIAYLTKTRGLSRRLVDEIIIIRHLFQEAETNNAIFPIYENHRIVGAERQGTLSHKRFKGVIPGSKYGCGYNLTFGDETAYALFFESALDLLSFIDISRMNGKDLQGCRLTSLAGLKQNILEHTIAQLPEARPFLCVDNDEAGQNFIAKNSGLEARLPDPDFKDWNELLLAMR